MAYPFIMGPIQLRWFRLLSDAFPQTAKSRTVPALKQVALDQLIFAPIGMFLFGQEEKIKMLVLARVCLG